MTSTLTATTDIFDDLLHPAWGTPAWPQKFQHFEPHQRQAITDVMTAYQSGVDVVLLDAPVGSGKTVIAEGVRRLLAEKSALYVAHTNGLVNQFMSDFGAYAKALKGKANYPTLDRPELFNDRFEPTSCADCALSSMELPACNSCTSATGDKVMHCVNCHPWFMCPYQVAKREAMQAPLAVTNTSYFVTEANGPGMFSARPFVIVDECDTLESILMGHITVEFSERRRAQYNVGVPELKGVESTWVDWCSHDALPKMTDALTDLQVEMGNYTQKGVSIPKATLKEFTYVSRQVAKLGRLESVLREGNAVYDYDTDKAKSGRSTNVADVRFKPVRIDADGPEMLWRHGKKWLCMSGTIIDPLEFVQGLGLDQTDKTWELVSVPMTFPVENRPIVVKPIANMVYREKEAEWPKMVKGIQAVLTAHPEDRILVHTVSYAFSQYCHDKLRHLPRMFYVYSDARERESVLEHFRNAPGAVLLAPSMDRGVDLPNDDCRIQVITKMPFMSIGDKMVSKRMYGKGGQLWYSVQTIRSLVQMTGRGVRHKEDWAITYILDKQFIDNVWRKSKQLLPQYWKDALDMTGGGLVVEL